MSYQLWRLGWYNFERLVQTLLKEEIGPGVESFGGTKDAGRDAAFSGKALSFPARTDLWDGNWVFQAKFVDTEKAGMEASAKRLLGTFKREMDSIVDRQKGSIDNYILWTNVEVSSSQRDDLRDVAVAALGCDVNFALVDGIDIGRILDARPQVRRSFPQLLGLADLDYLINRELYNRSFAFMHQWQPRLATFVQTAPYQKAVKTLAEKHFVVLDGPPEAGKTTIAAALALAYAVDGYAVVTLTGPGDFHAVFDKHHSQIFVADDAVGSNELDSSKGEDWSRDLSGVLACLGPNHKLVWTTRSYILKAALEKTRLEEAIHRFPATHEVLVEFGAYSELEKATILYNHAKAGRLTAEQKKLLRAVGMDLVRNENFTPERVRQLLEQVLPEIDSVPLPKAAAEIKAFFKDPSERWLKAYKALGPCEHQFLLALFDQGAGSDVENLRYQYEKQTMDISPSISFDLCTDFLAHSFIRVGTNWAGKPTIEFQHPSLRDILLRALSGHAGVKLRYIEHLSAKGAVTVLNSLLGTPGATEFTLVSEGERSAFLQRLRQLAAIPTPTQTWIQLLVIARAIVACKAPEHRQAYLNSALEAILESACSQELIEANPSWDELDWFEVLQRLYPLLPLCDSLRRPEYLGALFERLCHATYDAGIRFGGLFSEYEPLLAKRPSWAKKIEEWQLDFEESLADVMGEFPSSVPLLEEDFDQWKERAQEVLQIFEDCGDAVPRILRQEAVSLSQDIQDMIDQSHVTTPVVPDEDSEEDLSEWMRRVNSAWTPDRLIRDIDDE